jgi:uncharacterized repeat protein (TIGR01451 family)
MRHPGQVTLGNAVRWTEDGGVAMNRKELHVHGRRPFPSVMGLAFVLCLTGFGERAAFAVTVSPAPYVWFDQTSTPTKPPDVPPQVLIGETFTFRVRFNNNNPNVSAGLRILGYAPFIDLVLDAGGANMAKTGPCACDGMTFVGAKMIDVNGGAVPLVSYPNPGSPLSFPCPTSTPLTHQFSPGVLPVYGPPGSQLVTIELPFGSFDPSQPDVVVEVTAFASPLADVDVNLPYPLSISARGGFRYGGTLSPTPGSPVLSDLISISPFGQQTHSNQWLAQASTTPNVLIVGKKYLGPENETATGPNFIQSYRLTLDVATGQKVDHVTVTDHLPINMAYHGMGPVTSPSTCSLVPPTTTPGPGGPIDNAYPLPNNDLILKCDPGWITGVGPHDGIHHDATIDFEFFIPYLDGNGHPVLDPSSCIPVNSNNLVSAAGNWTRTPADPCDASSPVDVYTDMTPFPPLQDKCLAIQKTVVDLSGGPPAHPIPGDTLRYTLSFQLSDFRTAGNLVVRDVLSDGQTLVPGSLILTVTDQCNTFPTTTATTSGLIPATAVTQTLHLCGAGALPGDPPSFTQLDIDVSAAMISLATPATVPPEPFRHTHGILTGGHAFALTPLFTVPATGTIIFDTKIDDAYQCPVASPHDPYVDKDDPLTNTVGLTADILANVGNCSTTPGPTGVTAQDTSKVEFLIATDFLEKTVYAVKRASGVICGPSTISPTPCPATPDVIPGDDVTFRLKKTIPSSDAENLTIQDWLPLPIFHVLSTFGLSVPLCSGTPVSGNACQVTLPSWTYASPPMTLSLPPLTNSIKFTYGTFSDSTNTPREIDLLFTLTVTNDPFPDGLYLTNEAQECESNTFGSIFCQTAIAQLHVREPALRLTKGVVRASNPNAVFTPSLVGPITFTPPPGPPSCSPPRFSGTIDSTYLHPLSPAPIPFNSDISSVDANDVVTFAIVVENTGGSSAYNVQLQDVFPTGSDCFDPVFIPNSFCITDGTGATVPFTGVFGSLPFTLSNPLPGVSAPAGTNIAVITFDAKIVANIVPHCCDNTAKVLNYASTLNGQNFVAAGFGGPFQDTAQICVLPKATKSIKTTSEAHTPGTPPGPPLSPEQLAIGEIIRYRLQVLVPETTSASNYTLTDLLPPGLQFLNDGTATLAFVSNGGISSSTLNSSNCPGLAVVGSEANVAGITPTCPIPSTAILPFFGQGSFPCGVSPSFNLGNIKNTDSDPDQEFIVLEFNALVCNIATNLNGTSVPQNGTLLPNSLTVLVNNQVAATSNIVSAVVVEPKIKITKVVTSVVPPLTVPAIATYTVTLANIGTATAFDLQLTDVLSACAPTLTNPNSIPITTIGVVGVVNNLSTLTMLDVRIASIGVGGTVTVTYKATVSCVDCRRLINTAKVTWTSLPGTQGTTSNSTGSYTPHASGDPRGERDGSGGVNNYVASATASLCCMLVSNEKINCNSDGTFTYTFVVTNFSNSPSFGVNFLQLAGVTITPNPYVFPVAQFPSGLPPGGSAPVTVTIDPGAVSGPTICFTVELGWTGPIPGCETQVCIDLPKCCVQPPDSMVAWYPLDELQGATAVNDIAPPPSSSLNNVGTPQPGPVGAGGPVPVAGQVAGALYFTGKPYVEVPPQNDLNFGGGSFSIDGWVRVVNGSPGFFSPIVDKLNTGANTGFAFYLDQPSPGSAVLKLRVNASTYTSTGSITANANPISNTGPWFHIAVTVDSAGAGAFYINGLPAGNFTTSTGPFTNTVPMWIGQTRVPGSRCEIAIDELEIFNRALTQAEIQRISNARSAGKCKPDLAITKRAANTPWTVGGTGTFTLLVQNLGSGAVPAGTVITVTETLPAGLTLTPPSGAGWACTPTNGVGPLVVTCQYTVPSGGLPAAGSLPLITFPVNVTAAGPFRNCATVQGQMGGAVLQEPTSNDTSCITIPTSATPSPVVVQIPVVLDVFGVAPSHYTSDLVAVNRSGASTPVTMKYFPAPGTPGAGTAFSLPLSSALGSGREARVPDVLAFLRAGGYAPNIGPPEVGTLQLTFANVSDPSLVFAGSRTSTPNPNATVGGSFGLFLTGTPVGLAPTQSATIFALREDTAYRSNLAIEDVPGSGSGPPVLTLQVVDGDTGSLGASFTHPLASSGEWYQFGSILGPVANGYVTITKSGGGSDRFLAYGVVNDGPASGGGTSDGSLVGADGADGLVPIVLSVTSSGVLYTSELVLTNQTTGLAIATLTYTPAAALAGSGGPYAAYVLIAAGQQVRVADVISWLRGPPFLMPLPPAGVSQGGTLLVSGATAYVRTSNPNPDTAVGGTFGLAYPAVPASGRATSEAWVYGLVQDAATRTNVAIADARTGNLTVVTYVIDVFDAGTGSTTPVQTLTIPLAGGQWTQMNGILSGAGIAHGYVRVRPSSGTSDYVVYGVLNDGAGPGLGTSDGSYVAMSGVQ